MNKYDPSFPEEWLHELHEQIAEDNITVFRIYSYVEDCLPESEPNIIKEKTIEILKRLLAFQDTILIISTLNKEEVWDIPSEKILERLEKNWDLYSKYIAETDTEATLFLRKDLPKLPERVKIPIVYIKE